MPYGSNFPENNPIGSKEGFWHFVRDHDAATASVPAFLLPVGGHLQPGAGETWPREFRLPGTLEIDDSGRFPLLPPLSPAWPPT